jgi:hypothetical protein
MNLYFGCLLDEIRDRILSLVEHCFNIIELVYDHQFDGYIRVIQSSHFFDLKIKNKTCDRTNRMFDLLNCVFLRSNVETRVEF